jgi:predicted ATPase
MLTRLKVSGFKNLMDVDICLGPFTCIAGPNGVGKSNLFDAIQFLSALADKPLVEAALSVRSEGGRASDIRSLFHLHGDGFSPEMSFEAEMIIPEEGVDDLGQQARASITFLRYTLELAYRPGNGHSPLGNLEIKEERLVHITRGDAIKHLPFEHKKIWRESVIKGRRSGGPFISTDISEGKRNIRLHQDGGSRGRPTTLLATLPRTMLSSTNAAESPTALLARREMQSWKLLQLEPSALRKPDEFNAPARLRSDGLHLPATLYRLAHPQNGKEVGAGYAAGVYAEVGNRLSELIEDVHELHVDRDEKREMFTLYVRDRDQTLHAARSLSDGTLRFLALAVISRDPEAKGVLCLEEPENGIHPRRISAMLELLQDITMDVQEPLGEDNPLRQIIINTHSPTVVQLAPEGSLLIAESRYCADADKQWREAVFSGLPDTWRAQHGQRTCAKGILLSYLIPAAECPAALDERGMDHAAELRVIDRQDVQTLMSFMGRDDD